MNVVIKVINLSASSIKLGLENSVEIKSGEHEYTLKQSQAELVVKAASVMEELEVQLIPQESTDPSTVDGSKKINALSDKNKALEAELEKSKELVTKSEKLIAELEKSNAELAEQLKAAKAGGDKEPVEEPETTKAKATKSKTENKEK